MESRFEEIKERICNSLEITENKNKKEFEETKEFWFGFLVGLVDYGVITEEEYRILRDIVYAWKWKGKK